MQTGTIKLHRFIISQLLNQTRSQKSPPVAE